MKWINFLQKRKLKKEVYPSDTSRKERKWNYIKCAIKTPEGRKNKQKTKLGTKKKDNKQKTVTGMVDTNSTTSILTLNINCLNSPIKKQIQSGSENNTQLYVVSKKPTLNINTYINDK